MIFKETYDISLKNLRQKAFSLRSFLLIKAFWWAKSMLCPIRACKNAAKGREKIHITLVMLPADYEPFF